ncbi:hypothetical protein SBA3_4050007 [Candidatus Sulfopaludibacter sp. SbA3]|nr:hypothetical protein SBA3_4050007 [Candidatus Sulfopaludibacter sp. SbA3]
MGSRSQYWDRTTRQAAIKLTLCALIIFGFTCVMMQSTVWNRPPIPAREPFYTTLPGVDLSRVAPAKLPALLKHLNSWRCPCACLRTVASCRNHHGTCSFSVAIAREAAAAAEKP